jgi:hypothetical protein
MNNLLDLGSQRMATNMDDVMHFQRKKKKNNENFSELWALCAPAMINVSILLVMNNTVRNIT